MAQFKVGDVVVRSPEYRDEGGWGLGGVTLTVTEVGQFAGEGWIDTDNILGSGFASRFDLVKASPATPRMEDHKAEYRARSNDPATSVAAGKVERLSLRERVWVAMTRPSAIRAGRTGHELADLVDAPLNSVTPRLAELRRAGKIKDSGQRRDKQIVWVPA